MLDLLTIAGAVLALAVLLISHPLHKLERTIRHMSQATDALAAALVGLTTSVNALIAANAMPKENTAAVQASTDAVNALKATVDTALAPPAV